MRWKQPRVRQKQGPLNRRHQCYILLLVENANDAVINYSLAVFLSIQSAVVWYENNLNWTKTTAALTDFDIGFFPFPPPTPNRISSMNTQRVNLVISWWLNKLFDFWIILRLTEFEMWAACSVLLAQKDELCYWQRDLHMTFFIIICLRRTRVRFSQAQLPGWALRGQVQKCNLQSSLSTPVNCRVVRGDFCLGDQTHISGCNQGTLSIILGFLRTCLMSRMNKSCYPRIILWVSWIGMSLEVFKGLCVSPPILSLVPKET